MTRNKLCRFLEVDYTYGQGITGCKIITIDPICRECKKYKKNRRRTYHHRRATSRRHSDEKRA